MLPEGPDHFGLEVYKLIKKAICVYFDGII